MAAQTALRGTASNQIPDRATIATIDATPTMAHVPAVLAALASFVAMSPLREVTREQPRPQPAW